MADLLRLSADIIDGKASLEQTGPLNRINHQLSELNKDLAVVEAFSHCLVFTTDDGLVTFDTSNEQGGSKCVEAIRGWSKDPFNTVVFTHGHIDHVGGCGAFVADGPHPRIVGHENVAKRFERYRYTNGYNKVINERQFGQFRRRGYDLAGESQFLPIDTPAPDTTYSDCLDLSVGGTDFQLHHARGETDDHTWAWVPRHKAICAGDFFIWAFPNAGNPQKAQRYPREWAAAMREMASLGAELFLPAHGLPIHGQQRIAQVLDDAASALESLVEQTVRMMNEGARLNDIVHSVKLPAGTLDKPWLAPTYDEPEFVVQNIWRLYGGWYDGNPANLKPALDSSLAAELSALAGGALRLAERAAELKDDDPRLACHLVELAAQAAPDDLRVHELRAEVYQARRSQETSLMAKGIFGSASNESKAKL
ncbi:MBL fold metallo-hydrolase [Aequoribacter fuscus]|uniref:alkyl sulfatase dimerization domain-containing protein n=3 Tax=Aequoribacter fuscus TaxID=2518989 RepID=UPI0013638E0A|nr:alkyl sulfatase dimerization domain-containing protein [Aequoribacter fuscus]QHJ88612.1 MBL fold metallo-hydrolase [Aequoribacter fuscus]